MPEGELKNKYIADITWARNLVTRLNNLDYGQRELAIKQIKDVMDRDYKVCGFEPEEKEVNGFSLR